MKDLKKLWVEKVEKINKQELIKSRISVNQVLLNFIKEKSINSNLKKNV